MTRILFALVLLGLVFAVPIAYSQSSSTHHSVLDPDFMDTSVDPCTDFFTYSCGGWIKKNPIPPDRSSWGLSSKLADDNREQLREILEQAAAPAPDKDPVRQKIGDYYTACMDEKTIEAAGTTPLKPALEQISEMHSKGDIARIAAGVANQNVLFDFQSDQDFKDSSQVIAEVDQDGLGLPDRDYYVKTDPKSVELRQAYVAHVQKMLELLGDSPSVAANEAQSVMRIETALANGSLTQVERRDPKLLYHKMTREELEAISPSFSWKKYFSETGQPDLRSLNVTAPGFFKAMDGLLQKEDLDSWKAYWRWHLVHTNAPYLSAAFVNANFDFFGKTLSGTEELRPRWKRCVSYADNDLGEALGQAYVRRAFPPEAKARAQEMVKQIEQAMQRDIEGLDWMSPETKQKALEKLHAVANKIGYPDKWRDYSTLTIARDDEMGNVLRARAFEFHRQLAKIGKPVDRGEWGMSPPTVNAYYNPQINDINFPAGILQPPFFDPNADDAPNYGDMGATIGHELTHGFDDEGRQFDSQGNLRDWWTAEDGKQFEQRVSCVSDQYSQYVAVDDIKLNGQLTLGENVADLGGLMLAYMAWQNQTRGKNLDPIDGFTPEQRFFIGYGQSWCSETRDETKRMYATIDPHSPDEYRANGVVSNTPEFRQAFHCKEGSAMVRQNRCRVW
ncbi:MAG TPA: M13 family metallopeptidase [Terriglobales bacterium]|jgi:endothelin-converting enzyme/putative endopeptidase|nr:M13 family metallopeptidase [Terriglobales bacterium]